jgi:hypothetical protein
MHSRHRTSGIALSGAGRRPDACPVDEAGQRLVVPPPRLETDGEVDHVAFPGSEEVGAPVLTVSENEMNFWPIPGGWCLGLLPGDEGSSVTGSFYLA